ncbi:MAG: ATPase [Alteripontixanthobacter sp.]
MTRKSNLVAVGENAQQDAQSLDPHEIAGSQALPEDSASDDEWARDEWAEDPEVSSARGQWITPTLALLTIAGWTAFFGWVHHAAMLAGAPPAQWSAWITSWAVPVLLVVAVWLLARRTSIREAQRFGDTAAMLSNESARLEDRLTTVNRELSLAREFLAAETRELETLGRVAGDKLSEHAEHLQSLVRDNGKQVDAIASVSTTALENMDKLRGELPVIANSARDVSNQIGSAGRTAHGQLDDMVRGFERLNEFGQASENQVETLRSRITDAIGAFERQIGQMDDLTTARFAALRDQSEVFRAELDGREVEALADMRHRADSLNEEIGNARTALESEEEEALKSLRARLGSLREEAATIGNAVREQETAAIERWANSVGQMQDRLSEAVTTLSQIDEQALENSNAKLQALKDEADAIDGKLIERDKQFYDKLVQRGLQLDRQAEQAVSLLDERFADLDQRVAERSEAQIAAADMIAQRSGEIGQRVEEFRAEVAALAQQGGETERNLLSGAEQLAEKLAESRSMLDGTDSAIAGLTDASVRLLELVRGAAERAREDIPQALGEAEERLSTLRGEASTIREIMTEASDRGAALSEYVISSKDDGRDAAESIATLHGRLAQAGTDHAERLQALRREVEDLGRESDTVSAKAQDDLKNAIGVLEQAVRNAHEDLFAGTSDNIRAFADKVGGEAAEAVEKALREKTEGGIADLEERSAQAAHVSREATIQLRDQLAKVNELAGNLETRVNRARERAEEQVDNDFSRRVALITESLNSNAIDISKALATDVTDTAWASYLRGDRGIFTRRAVSLLDSTEARDIAEVYDADPDFREHASRYIHDFEAMLRTMLSTRDGNALGVTLLSSDMGKLYVALAQALDRLREQ